MAALSFSASPTLLHNCTSRTPPTAKITPKSVPYLPSTFKNSKLFDAYKIIETQSRKWRIGFSLFPYLLIKDRESLKKELLEAIAPLDLGAAASPEDQQRIDQIARELEAVNTVKQPLKSSLLNGKWELLYTTSTAILKTERPKFLRPNGKIYQAINVDTLRAQNLETWPFFNQATANLVPLNASRVAVKFDAFKIAALIPIKSRGSGQGQLEITYLDEELRISRGNQGNLFILKMVDPTYRKFSDQIIFVSWIRKGFDMKDPPFSG